MSRPCGILEGECLEQAGFTVVELLVALTLFSLLGMLIFGNVRFGIRAWEIGNARADQNDTIATTQGLLRRIVGEAYPLLLRDDPLHLSVDFEGTNESVSVLSPAPVVMGSGGRFRFRVATARRDRQLDLVMTSDPELAGSQQRPTSSNTILLANVDRAEFSYFGKTPADKIAKWHSAWARQIELPQLVRIRIAFLSGDQRVWPDLLIAPRISVDVGCVYDVLTKRCRGR